MFPYSAISLNIKNSKQGKRPLSETVEGRGVLRCLNEEIGALQSCDTPQVMPLRNGTAGFESHVS